MGANIFYLTRHQKETCSSCNTKLISRVTDRFVVFHIYLIAQVWSFWIGWVLRMMLADMDLMKLKTTNPVNPMLATRAGLLRKSEISD